MQKIGLQPGCFTNIGPISLLENNLKNNQRNYGIDLLRLVGAFYVLILHSLNHGGVITAAIKGTLAYDILYFMEITAHSAVNIFVIISGYTSSQANNFKKDWHRLIVLWLEVVFYTVVIHLFFVISGKIAYNQASLLETFFPLTNNFYWYFSCYFGLYFFKPFLDRAIESIGENHLKLFVFLLFLGYSVYSLGHEVFITVGGYSVIWFMVLYLIGASARKCRFGEKLSSLKIIFLIFGMIAVTWLWNKYGVEFKIFTKLYRTDFLISYISPTITAIALLHVILFSRLRFHECFKKIIRFSSPSAFSVYLMNDHPYYRNLILSGYFASWAGRRSSVLIPQILLYCVSFLVFAVLVDKIRQLIFRKINITKIFFRM